MRPPEGSFPFRSSEVARRLSGNAYPQGAGVEGTMREFGRSDATARRSENVLAMFLRASIETLRGDLESVRAHLELTRDERARRDEGLPYRLEEALHGIGRLRNRFAEFEHAAEQVLLRLEGPVEATTECREPTVPPPRPSKPTSPSNDGV